MLAPSARLPVRSSLDMYSKILTRLEENEYDNFRKVRTLRHFCLRPVTLTSIACTVGRARAARLRLQAGEIFGPAKIVVEDPSSEHGMTRRVPST